LIADGETEAAAGWNIDHPAERAPSSLAEVNAGRSVGGSAVVNGQEIWGLSSFKGKQDRLANEDVYRGIDGERGLGQRDCGQNGEGGDTDDRLHCARR